jgi:hypothetical protein
MSATSVSIKDVQLGIHLTTANAPAWVQQMTHMLKARRLWTVLNKDSPEKQEAHNAPFTLTCNVGDDVLHLFDEDKTPKEIWEEIKKQCLGA